MSLKQWIALITFITSTWILFSGKFTPIIEDISGFVCILSLFLVLIKASIKEISLFICFAAAFRLHYSSDIVSYIIGMVMVAVNFWSYGVTRGTKNHPNEVSIAPRKAPNEADFFFILSFLIGIGLLIYSFFDKEVML